MANYYTDIPELKFHLNNPMMKRICELKERNYRDKMNSIMLRWTSKML